MGRTRIGSWLGCMLLAVIATSCFETRERYGGETHFMRGCDGACEAGLECVCGVCTQPCEHSATCEALAAGATCAAVDAEAQACGQMRADAPVPARACLATCARDVDCAELGDGFTCAQGQCRERAVASAPAVFVTDAGVGGCSGAACAVAEQPLVLLVVDTSGSMERKPSCSCTTAGCQECLPDCARGERNRWAQVLEALSGTFEEFSCESIERSEENGATFDLGYYLPYHAPRGVQRDDGVLDSYRDRVRFGLATFDSWDTYVGQPPLVPIAEFELDKSATEAGAWSYNPTFALNRLVLRDHGSTVGSLYYPGCTTAYYMDTGVRGPQATQGALRVAVDPARADEVADRIQADLLTVRPYGGTPTAAALDDLYHFMSADPAMEVERARPVAKHVVLITDGYPDADYRDVGCDCADSNPGDPMPCGGDPSNPAYAPELQHCPYPTAEEAARALRCAEGASCSGLASQVHTVGFAIDDENVRQRLEALAQSGGTERARFAEDGAELRVQLEALLEELAQ